MRVVTVQAAIRAEALASFLDASIANGRGAVATEAGCRRFDIFHDGTDSGRVGFNEVYDNDDAVAAHGETPHFAEWLAATDGMADGDMVWATCRNVLPGVTAQWDVGPISANLPGPVGGLYVHQARVSVGAGRVEEFTDSVATYRRDAVAAEPGLLRFDVNQSVDDEAEFWLYKVQTGRDAAAAHADAPYSVVHHAAFADVYENSGTLVVSGPNVWPPDDRVWTSQAP